MKKTKKIIISVIVFLAALFGFLADGCSFFGQFKGDESEEVIPPKNERNISVNEKGTYIEGDQINVYNDKSVDSSKPINAKEALFKMANNLKGANPENFKFGACLYFHGQDGKIDDWAYHGPVKLKRILKLFNDMPIIKLDYSKNPHNISDEIWIGPICNCKDYRFTVKEIKTLGLNFLNTLGHLGAQENLEDCFEY